MRSWVVGVLLSIIVAWLLRMGWVDPQSTGPLLATAPMVARPVVAAGVEGSAFEVLHAADLAVAVSRFAAHAPAHEVRRLRAEVDASCRVLALLEQDRPSQADLRRDAAQQELRRRCASLPVPSLYVPVADTRMPADDVTDASAGTQALEKLRTARRPGPLIEAWLEAFSHDVLPQQQIFHDRRRLLPAEAEALIRVVVDLRECARLDACGPRSLFALRVCALHGCDGDSDVRSAWHQALSPRDYESVLAIHAWLQNWQAGRAQ